MVTCSKCAREFAREEAHYAGTFGINARRRTYCPRCWRKVEWARNHTHSHSRPAAAPGAYEERQIARYWERVDNYRELGYDPNQG